MSLFSSKNADDNTDGKPTRVDELAAGDSIKVDDAWVLVTKRPHFDGSGEEVELPYAAPDGKSGGNVNVYPHDEFLCIKAD